jgi:hypothetical protein
MRFTDANAARAYAAAALRPLPSLPLLLLLPCLRRAEMSAQSRRSLQGQSFHFGIRVSHKPVV